MDIFDTIRARHSVRTFAGVPLDETQTRTLREAIDSASSPFGGGVSIRLCRFDLKGPQKPGTYGTITGASDYLLMAYGDGRESALSAGYMMEQVVLRATSMGLGTCWIAATFRGGDFDRGQTWPDGESLKIISPVGHPAPRKSLRDRLTSTFARSGTRKPFGELFFDGSFGVSLSEESLFGESLAMLRLAPSSVNSQPWRAVVCDGTVHFYCKSAKPLYILDSGIGLCHFHLAENAIGAGGEFVELADFPAPPADLRYLMSYRRI